MFGGWREAFFRSIWGCVLGGKGWLMLFGKLETPQAEIKQGPWCPHDLLGVSVHLPLQRPAERVGSGLTGVWRSHCVPVGNREH